MNSDFSDLLRLFNDNRVEYLVVGGYAVVAYTEPRYTKDLDVWIWARPENATRVFQALKDFGAPLAGMSALDFADLGFVFQIGVAPVRIDVLMSVDGLSFEDAWPNRVWIDFGGVEGWVISRIDLIRNKRVSGRLQDQLDVQNLEKEPLI